MIKFIILLAGILLLSNCATVGKPFEFKGPKSIINGKTTQSQIISTYGEPFRVGYENGDLKWTFGYYQYKLFGNSDSKDLNITFDKNNVVSGYTYSSSVPEEVITFVHQK